MKYIVLFHQFLIILTKIFWWLWDSHWEYNCKLSTILTLLTSWQRSGSCDKEDITFYLINRTDDSKTNKRLFNFFVDIFQKYNFRKYLANIFPKKGSMCQLLQSHVWIQIIWFAGPKPNLQYHWKLLLSKRPTASSYVLDLPLNQYNSTIFSLLINKW